MIEPIRMLHGPQRPRRTLGEAVARLVDGPLAVISAGWQEGEGDLEDLQALLGRPLVELGLYRRAQQVFEADPRLGRAHRQRQDRLRALQQLYRERLAHLAAAAGAMLTSKTEGELRAAELRHAVSQLRALDRHHLHRTEELQLQFEDDFAVAEHPEVLSHREALREQLARCAGVVLTGGNVMVLLNRMRLFAMGEALAPVPILAWSAGAMVLADRIVLYHDRAPGGRREPEVMGTGTGLVDGYLFLPDPRRRLDRDAASALALFARRFSPTPCVLLDNGSELCFAGRRLDSCAAADVIGRSGELQPLEAGP